MSKSDGQNSGFWSVTLPSCPVCCRHRSTEIGNEVNYHLTGGGQETFDLTIYASYVFRSGKHLSRLLSYLRESYDAMVKALQNLKKKITWASPRESLPLAYQLTTFPVSVERWWQQTEQLGGVTDQNPLFWPSDFDILSGQHGENWLSSSLDCR